MNKNELISEIFEFEKELERNYDRRLLLRDKFKPYFINEGVLFREIKRNNKSLKISAESLNSGEELIAFYENFFKLLDENGSVPYSNDKLEDSKSKYFKKLNSFLATGYDSFERIYQNPNSSQTDSIYSVFQKRFQKNFAEEVDIKGKTLREWYNFEYVKYFLALLASCIGLALTGLVQLLFNNLIASSILGGIFCFIIAFDLIRTQYTLRKNRITKIEEEFFNNIFETKSEKEFFKYIKLCKYENYLNDYFKGDVLYEELKRRNNFNTTNSENEIVGN